ncbi:peptide chain release factor 3 [Brachybacterium sp. FME24]|uniref:peptide chain release factor 3 n=1 Tax=Brachybacterium sp. FME24 TaxID=2742605 RepID=UPI0018685754
MMHIDSDSAAPPLRVLDEAMRRRTFAVISHPDAGKSTLTEAMALHAHVVDEAGVTHGKARRAASISDWGEVERERGISITSSALRFDYQDVVFNLLDTPGHSDFSEDTYRVLTAVDFAVMLIDAAKGMEAQTRKLFDVCRRLGLPVVTVINKWDRPGLEALELFDEIQEVTARTPVAVNWPVGYAGKFRGLLEPGASSYLRHEVVASGARLADERLVDGATDGDLDEETWRDAAEGVGVAAELNGSFAVQPFLDGEQTPVLFTAAAGNIGVRVLLDFLVDHAPPPQPRLDEEGTPRPIEAELAGYVFKIQAGMNPAHRDQVAFVRVNSGVFERGMELRHAQTGRPVSSKYAHHLVGRGRETIDESWPGDVVGFVNTTGLHVGDTIHGGKPVTFPGMPRFDPERFRVARSLDSARNKRFVKGLAQLEDDGTIQILRDANGSPGGPVLAAVGELQFEVAVERMRREFGVEIALDAPMPYDRSRTFARSEVGRIASVVGVEVLYRPDGEPVALFPDRWRLSRVQERFPEVFPERAV